MVEILSVVAFAIFIAAQFLAVVFCKAYANEEWSRRESEESSPRERARARETWKQYVDL